MRWSHYLFSAVQFFQVLILVLGGIFCCVLPFAPALRVKIADSFLFKDSLFFCLGVILLSIGLILGIGFYFLQRHGSLQLSMDPSVSVDSELVGAVVQTYLQERFPDRKVKAEVIFQNGLIEVVAENLLSLEEKHLLEMEVEIGDLLKRTLNYQKKFRMTVS